MKLNRLLNACFFLVLFFLLGQKTLASTDWKLTHEDILVDKNAPWTVIAIADANLGSRYERLKKCLPSGHGTNIHLISILNPKSVPRVQLYASQLFPDSSSSYGLALFKKLTLHMDSLKQSKNIKSKALYGHSLSGLFAAWVALQPDCPFDVVYAASPSCWVGRSKIATLGDSIVYAQTHVLVGGFERFNLVFYSSKKYAQRNHNVSFSSTPFRGHGSTVSKGFINLTHMLWR